MLKQVQPNKWSCFPTSCAMLWEMPIKELILLIGHDGSEILWPNQPEPMNRRAFNSQEMLKIGLEIGEPLVPIYKETAQAPHDKVKPFMLYWEYTIELFLKLKDAVLIGETKSGYMHAVYWDSKEQLCFDPNGITYKLDRFNPELILIRGK